MQTNHNTSIDLRTLASAICALRDAEGALDGLRRDHAEQLAERDAPELLSGYDDLADAVLDVATQCVELRDALSAVGEELGATDHVVQTAKGPANFAWWNTEWKADDPNAIALAETQAKLREAEATS